MEIDKDRIEEAIVQSVAESMASDGELEARIKSAVNRRIDEHFKNVGDARIAAAVEQSITEGFEHEYCRVTSFGERSGQPTTIRKELEKLVTGYWNQQVNKSDGKPSDSSYNSITRAEWTMLKIVAADFSGEMKQHVVNIGGSLKDSLRSELHSTVNKLLSEVFHVQSEGDRSLNKPGRSCIDPEQTGKA